MTDLEQARAAMLAESEKGTKCPCCGQTVKLYKRKLHAEMADFLVKLVRKYRNHQRYYSTRELLPDAVKAATDGSYLVKWGLVEKVDSSNTAGGKAGLYRPTPMGVDFVMGRINVVSHIHMLCGVFVGYSDTYVSIKDCLGEDFDYPELMTS